MGKIFLSYARADDALARNVAHDLRAANLELWIDKDDIEPGQRWDRAVEKAIDECGSLVVLVSSKSIDSDIVLDEVYYALEQKKQVFPVIVETCHIPLRLRRLESIEFDNDYDGSLERLIKALKEDTAKTDEPADTQASFAFHPGQRHTPSIAVLPFNTVTAENESTTVLSDGLLTEIVHGLSLNPSLFVIASGTTRTYRGASPQIGQIARELRVSYILVGQLTVVGQTLRVSCELVKARSGQIVWSDRFDRPIADIFKIQDEITRAIVHRLQRRLGDHERRGVLKKPTESLTAWEMLQRALYYGWSYEWLTDSIGLLDRAIELDPKLAEAHALLAARMAYMLWYGELDKVADSLSHADRALELAPENTHCLVCASVAYNANGQSKKALDLVTQAREANPNSADAWGYNGLYLAVTGRNSEALEMIHYAFELSPKDPVRYLWYAHKAICYANQDEYEKALEACQNSTNLHNHWFWSMMAQAQSQAMIGNFAEAKQDWQRARTLNSNVSIPNFKLWLTASALSAGQQEAVCDALVQAGCE